MVIGKKERYVMALCHHVVTKEHGTSEYSVGTIAAVAVVAADVAGRPKNDFQGIYLIESIV